jgi:hypothetical protein
MRAVRVDPDALPQFAFENIATSAARHRIGDKMLKQFLTLLAAGLAIAGAAHAQTKGEYKLTVVAAKPASFGVVAEEWAKQLDPQPFEALDKSAASGKRQAVRVA